MSSIRHRLFNRSQIRRTESSGHFSSDEENHDKIEKSDRIDKTEKSDKTEKNDKANPKRLKTRSLSNKVRRFSLDNLSL